MKTFLILCFVLAAYIATAQSDNFMLDKTRKEVIESMKNMTTYELTKDTTVAVSPTARTREFLLKDLKQIPSNGIIAYIFYFENEYKDQCTSVRTMIIDKEKLQNTIDVLNRSTRRIAPHVWIDDLRNVTLTLYTFNGGDQVVYFFDIKR